MHNEVYEFVAKCVTGVDFTEKRVLEIGSKNVNGTVKTLFGGAFYLGIDLLPGKDVDLVIGANDFSKLEFWKNTFEYCVSAEALEHCPDPLDILICAIECLKPGGKFIVTAAAPNRTPHRADGEAGDPAENGEFYANVDPKELEDWLWAVRFVGIEVSQVGDGVQGTAIKP